MIKLLFFIFLATPAVFAAQSDADFDSLGGNKILLERAQALQPEQQHSVVQNRMVSRTSRMEISPEFSGTFGGDTYSRTRSVGLNLNYHFNPRWSVGVKYNHSFNDLTAEGEAMMDRAYADYLEDPANPDQGFPQLNYPKSETLALINWYPFYGKISLFEKAVAHFDFYFIGGYGQVALKDGSTPTYTGGAGLGFWLSPHVSSRIEMRYQNYKAQYFTGEKSMDLAIASMQLGWLL